MHLSFDLIIFLLLSLLKYIRLVVNIIAFWTYQPTPIADDPKHTPRDVTVVIPSLDGQGPDLAATLRSCARSEPHQIFLVTIDANFAVASKLAASISKLITVLSVPIANKRRQLCHALPHVRTEFTIFADDDVTWPSTTLLPWILAPFSDPRVGGVGTSQRYGRRGQETPNAWEFLGCGYLIRRNFDIISCNHVDGGLPCLSGRTVAYRTSIIQDPEFSCAFTNETWRSFQLNADDDNFLTRWLMNNGWDIRIQAHRECEIETTLEGNSKYLLQCMRWSRSNWRSNLKSLAIERTVWLKHPWSTFAVFQTTITSWSLLFDAMLCWLWWRLCKCHQIGWITSAVVYLWIVLFCRVVKYAGHFRRYPGDLIYVPLIPLFGWYHSIGIKLHALFTLQITAWGSREGADKDDNHRMIGPLPTYTEHADANKFELGDDTIATCIILDEEEYPLLPVYSAEL